MKPLLQRAPDPPTRGLPGAPSHAAVDDATLHHLRVVVFSDAIPGRNGVGTFYDDLAAALAGHVGAIRVIAPPEDPAPGEKGWSLSMPGDPTQRVHIPWVPQIWSQVRWTRPHVVLAATPSLYGVTGLVMARRVGAGAALCYHTEFPKLAETYWSGVRARMVPRLLGIWDRILLRLSPSVLAPNLELADVLARKGRGDARVMATLAPQAFVDAPPAPAPRSLQRVAFVGRLAPEKRVDQVLAAAHAHPDLRFHLVGDGPLRDTVREAAGSLANLTHTPWVDRTVVMRALDASDLLVLPSRHETFGTAAFEAMIRGRPALVSPACGITAWPQLAPGLLAMEPGESVTDALRRLECVPSEALRQTAVSARQAAMRVHDDAVVQWLRLLRGLAGEQAGDQG